MTGRTFYVTDMPRLLRRDGTTFTPPVWIEDRRGARRHGVDSIPLARAGFDTH